MFVGAQEEISLLFAWQLLKINPWMGWTVTCGGDWGQVAGVPAARTPPGVSELEGFVMLQHGTRTWWVKIQIIWI